jgi:hypothetical protein
MIVVDKKISKKELQLLAENLFGDMIKGVVDVEKEILAIDAELHSDLEYFLLQKGSLQENLWGINLYPSLDGDDFFEFDSLINIRPHQNNRSRSVEDLSIQNKIINIIKNKVEW